MSASSLAAKFDSSLAKPNTRSNLVIGSQINISSGGGGGGGGGERDNGAVYKLAKKTISPVFTTQSIFLPKLPPKLFGKSIKETEYIDYMGGFFIRPQSSLQDDKEEYLFRGDLLKATQICLVTSPISFSDTIKRIKTAESPYKDFSKPCKSAISTDRVQQSSYSRSTGSLAGPTRSSTSVVGNTTARSSATRKLSSKRFRSPPSMRNNNTRLENEKSFVSQKSTKLSSDQQMMLSSRKGTTEYWLEKSILDLKNTQPDVAIHALDFIWEFHMSILKNSDFLRNALEAQSYLPPEEIKARLARSKRRASRSNYIGDAKLDAMTHLFLDIDEHSLIDQKSFGVALKNFYQPEVIVIPSDLAGGVLVAAHFLQFESLRIKAIERFAQSLNLRTISKFFQCANKCQETKAIESCENWLCIHLFENMTNSKLLRQIPFDFLKKVINSNRLFTCDEYSIFEILVNWVFFKLNPTVYQLPNQNILVAYFASLNKSSSFFDQCPEAKELFVSVRLNGINRSNLLETIEQMNIYPRPYLIKSIMEIQHSLENGGDMKLSRDFERSSIRQGFVLETEKLFYSETFSLYGFNFELIVEQKVPSVFEFYIQRLNSNDCGLTYQKIQVEAVSLRNERRSQYLISVQYWSGREIVHECSGILRHTFGRTWWQTTRPFQVDLTSRNNKNPPTTTNVCCLEASSSSTVAATAAAATNNDNFNQHSNRPGKDAGGNDEKYDNNIINTSCPKKLFVMFSFAFPSDS